MTETEKKIEKLNAQIIAINQTLRQDIKNLYNNTINQNDKQQQYEEAIENFMEINAENYIKTKQEKYSDTLYAILDISTKEHYENTEKKLLTGIKAYLEEQEQTKMNKQKNFFILNLSITLFSIIIALIAILK